MEEIEVTIKLDTINKVKDFVETVSKYDEEVIIKSHRYEINAKSIMGVFSLNLLEPVIVCLYSDNKNIQNKFIKEIEKFMEEWNMKYETIIDLDNVTLQDCIDLYEKKNIYIEISDGHIVDLIKEK